MGQAATRTDNITALLEGWSGGDREAAEILFPLIYDELRRMAAGYLRGQRPGHTLQPTALVHEAYCRLVEQKDWGWRNRRHFYAIAAKMMRRILVDHARRDLYVKRGGGLNRVPMDELREPGWERAPDLIALDDALKSLEQFDPRKSRIVELRFFVGLDLRQTADVMGLSTATLSRHWAAAKAWLYRELAEEQTS